MRPSVGHTLVSHLCYLYRVSILHIIYELEPLHLSFLEGKRRKVESLKVLLSQLNQPTAKRAFLEETHKNFCFSQEVYYFS